MIKVKIGRNKYEVKSCFDECDVDEISHVLVAQNFLAAKVMYAKQMASLKISILIKLSKIPIDIFMKLNSGQQIAILNTIRWSFKAKIEKKPFEFFEVDGTKFYLPDDSYVNTSSIEMALLNIYYLSFTRKNSAITDMVYLIAATICRPERKDLSVFKKIVEKWTGDRREVFNLVLADERSKFFKEKAPLGVMIAVLQYWEAMNNRFVKRFDDVFNGGDGKALFQNGEGWLAMLEDIAEIGVIGNLEKVHETNAYSMMMYVEHKQKKLERLEEMRAAQEN